MKKTVMCIVENQHTVESIVTKLKDANFSSNDISVLFPDKTGTKDFAHEHHTKAPEGAIAGVGAGGVLGGTLGLLVGIGALAIPGLGPFIAAGPLLAALSGVAAGAASDASPPGRAAMMPAASTTSAYVDVSARMVVAATCDACVTASDSASCSASRHPTLIGRSTISATRAQVRSRAAGD